MNGDGLRLIALSGRASFDLNGDVLAEKLAWTAPGSDDAWLAFDRDGDGIIDRNDAVFPSLRLWQDSTTTVSRKRVSYTPCKNSASPA